MGGNKSEHNCCLKIISWYPSELPSFPSSLVVIRNKNYLSCEIAGEVFFIVENCFGYENEEEKEMGRLINIENYHQGKSQENEKREKRKTSKESSRIAALIFLLAPFTLLTQPNWKESTQVVRTEHLVNKVNGQQGSKLSDEILRKHHLRKSFHWDLL